MAAAIVSLAAFMPLGLWSTAAATTDFKSSDSAAEWVTISFEWPFVLEDGTPAPHRILAPDLCLKESANLDPDRVGARIQSHYSGFVSFDKVDGSYVVVANPEGIPASWKIDNLLDVKISMSIKNGTVWEALKQLVQEVNRLGSGPRVLQLLVDLYGYGRGMPPPVAEVRCVTIEVDQVPARDVLCAILRQAPLTIRYNYFVYPPHPRKSPRLPQGALNFNYYKGGLEDDGSDNPWPAQEVVIQKQEWWLEEIAEANAIPEERLQKLRQEGIIEGIAEGISGTGY